MTHVDWLWWIGVAAMVVAALFIRDDRTSKWVYSGGIAMATAAIDTDPDVATPVKWICTGLFAVIIFGYCFGPWWTDRKKEERNAQQEVQQGQVDGVGPEEAQGRASDG